MDKKRRIELLSRYQEAIAQRLWDQWNCIGLNGLSRTEHEPEWAIDPEALILASSRMFHLEPRLRESVLSWIIQNGDFVSIARLKRIQKDYQVGDADNMADAARTILECTPSALSWRSIAKWKEPKTVSDSSAEIRTLAGKFSPARPQCTFLRLRGLFGVTSRVEILFWLFYNARCPVSMLARETAWSVQTVQKTLKEMVQSGHVFSEKERVPVTRYFVRQDDWKAFFSSDGIDDFNRIYLGQFDLYTGVFRMMNALEKAATTEDDDYALFIMKEGHTESFSPHFRARSYTLAASDSRNHKNSVSASIERLVENAESSKQWPVGAFTLNPESARRE